MTIATNLLSHEILACHLRHDAARCLGPVRQDDVPLDGPEASSCDDRVGQDDEHRD